MSTRLTPEESRLVERRFPRVLAYTVLTLGIYGLYWLYSVNEQLGLEYDVEYSSLWRTLGLLVPVYDLLVPCRFSRTAADHLVEDQTGQVLFLRWVVFLPAAVSLVRSGTCRKVAAW